MCGFITVRTSKHLSEYQIQCNLDNYYDKLRAKQREVKSGKNNKKVILK